MNKNQFLIMYGIGLIISAGVILYTIIEANILPLSWDKQLVNIILTAMWYEKMLPYVIAFVAALFIWIALLMRTKEIKENEPNST